MQQRIWFFIVSRLVPWAILLSLAWLQSLVWVCWEKKVVNFCNLLPELFWTSGLRILPLFSERSFALQKALSCNALYQELDFWEGKSKVKLGVFKWLGWNHSGETWREVVASWVLTCIDGTDTSNVGPFSAYARFLQTREIRCSPLVFWQVVGRGPPPTPFGFPSHPAVTISTLSSYTARKLRRRVPSGPEHNFSASSEREPALFFESLATTTCPFVKPER